MQETSITSLIYNSFRFVEGHLTKSIGEIRANSDSKNESYNLYEPGTSDPNLIKPKEFK